VKSLHQTRKSSGLLSEKLLEDLHLNCEDFECDWSDNPPQCRTPKWSIQLAGLQEVRWPNSGETSINNTTFFWSGRQDGLRKEGVALALPSNLISACVAWAPVSECLLFARFKHSLGHVSVVICYAPTNCTQTAIKEQFYVYLEAAFSRCGKNDLKIVLADFNAETGTLRHPGDWGTGTTNENLDLFLSFCRGRRLSIAGSWFRRRHTPLLLDLWRPSHQEGG